MRYVSPASRSMKFVTCIIQKERVSDRQKRKKNRPSRYLDRMKNKSRVGRVQVKKATLIIIPLPYLYISRILTTSSVPPPAKAAVRVVRQEKRGSKRIRNRIITWSMDHSMEMSRRMVMKIPP